MSKDGYAGDIKMNHRERLKELAAAIARDTFSAIWNKGCPHNYGHPAQDCIECIKRGFAEMITTALTTARQEEREKAIKSLTKYGRHKECELELGKDSYCEKCPTGKDHYCTCGLKCTCGFSDAIRTQEGA